MARITDDPRDPELTRGGDTVPTPQADVYLIGPRGEKLVRPVRDKYIHSTCGGETKMSHEIAFTYAQNPNFYGFTYCVHCKMHKPVSEFKWSNTEDIVGS